MSSGPPDGLRGRRGQASRDFDGRQSASGEFRMAGKQDMDDAGDAPDGAGAAASEGAAVEAESATAMVTDFPASSDQPGRFDISEYQHGLYGGPAADLIGNHERSMPVSRAGEHEPRHQMTVPEPEPERDTGSLVRPYARTGGRTRSEYELAIEALVSTSERGRTRGAAVRPEYRSICGLCMDARSVAEVAAHLRLPLGVARVLIGDMAGMGLVMIHESGMVMGDRPSMEFLERVLSGLRRL
ncbi:MAG: DUF742 domain-containing protein [Sciscionella sp.]